MKMKKIAVRSAVATALLFAGVAGIAPAQTPSLALLAGLEQGNWQLKQRGSTQGSMNLCLGDPKILLQIQHRNDNCSVFATKDTPRLVEVSYTCRTGHGVTTIRRESSRLVQVQSQGIDQGRLFSFALEARHTGQCG